MYVVVLKVDLLNLATGLVPMKKFGLNLLTPFCKLDHFRAMEK
jgi:hypothetical protein